MVTGPAAQKAIELSQGNIGFDLVDIPLASVLRGSKRW
jgi:hypothetical protein